MARQTAISNSVMPVNRRALPWSSWSQSTTTARVGAARKKVLIQPARTEVSMIASAPKIQKRRQTTSFVSSLMKDYLTAKNAKGAKINSISPRSSRRTRTLQDFDISKFFTHALRELRGESPFCLLRQEAQVDQRIDFRLCERLRQELVPYAIFDRCL